jgi:hypothetical protein
MFSIHISLLLSVAVIAAVIRLEYLINFSPEIAFLLLTLRSSFRNSVIPLFYGLLWV